MPHASLHTLLWNILNIPRLKPKINLNRGDKQHGPDSRQLECMPAWLGQGLAAPCWGRHQSFGCWMAEWAGRSQGGIWGGCTGRGSRKDFLPAGEQMLPCVTTSAAILVYTSLKTSLNRWVTFGYFIKVFPHLLSFLRHETEHAPAHCMLCYLERLLRKLNTHITTEPFLEVSSEQNSAILKNIMTPLPHSTNLDSSANTE